MSGTARQRHQLSTLLMDAYTHRAEIEDKIAQAKRNRKESGNKYGEEMQNIVYIPMLTINIARFLNLSCSPILSFAFNFIRWWPLERLNILHCIVHVFHYRKGFAFDPTHPPHPMRVRKRFLTTTTTPHL